MFYHSPWLLLKRVMETCSRRAQKCTQIHAKLPWTLSTTKWELKSPNFFFFLKFSSTNLIKVCSTALEFLFGYRDGKMDIAVVRVTPKAMQSDQKFKKRKYMFWTTFSRTRRRSDFVDWDTAKWKTNEQQNCKFHIIGQQKKQKIKQCLISGYVRNIRIFIKF